ncbi:hypothetical protein C2845_PM15G18140 [Panicum miliaceum]|uniref:Uncharacterized protein n=1 Tax=Panicum miliaceum TaxID=4540 RepID=A0A3L6Q9Y8_PANMI|nr:hypothetical protein C2845_PM15G18140 [Panicum miliaceum]
MTVSCSSTETHYDGDEFCDGGACTALSCKRDMMRIGRAAAGTAGGVVDRPSPTCRGGSGAAAPPPLASLVPEQCLTVANVKAIAEKHGRSFGRFLPLPPPMIPAAPPAAAPPQMAEAGATAAAADRHGDDEVYIDAEILTAADCQLPCNPDDDFIGLLDVDMDLIFSEI